MNLYHTPLLKDFNRELEERVLNCSGVYLGLRGSGFRV